MNQAKTLQDIMFEEIELCVRTTQNLLLHIKDTDWDYRPAENMRTLRRTCNPPCFYSSHRSLYLKRRTIREGSRA